MAEQTATPKTQAPDTQTPAGPTPGAPEPARVREMFDSIAGRYDLLNHVLSLQQDRYWRYRAARRALSGFAHPRVLDLCCGTGDLALALKRRDRSAKVFCADFSFPMLQHARDKHAGDPPMQVDALSLPFASESLDVITVAFGVRNWADRTRGFREAARVLRPGGRFVVLEFSKPPDTWFGALYRFYSKYVMPKVGSVLSRNRQAYSYLPESVAAFRSPEDLLSELEAAGFQRVEFVTFAGGTVALHTGSKLAGPRAESPR